MKILFMCVANSARSQLAEGLAKSLLGPQIEIQSAGSMPSTVNPLAIQVLKEIGIDISKQYSKSVDQLPTKFISQLNYVITLCAEEVCPVVNSKAKKLHWPFPDPASAIGSDLEKIEGFRTARDSIRKKLEEFKSEIIPQIPKK